MENFRCGFNLWRYQLEPSSSSFVMDWVRNRFTGVQFFFGTCRTTLCDHIQILMTPLWGVCSGRPFATMMMMVMTMMTNRIPFVRFESDCIMSLIKDPIMHTGWCCLLNWESYDHGEPVWPDVNCDRSTATDLVLFGWQREDIQSNGINKYTRTGLD